jgi:AcrR family transcriptional regulator
VEEAMSTAVQDPGEAARSARAETRSRQLLAAAARLMARDSSDSVSMQAVAAEAGVSVGLIYRYFGGKDDLLLAVILGVLDAFAAEVPAAIDEAGEDPVERLAAGFRAYCRVIDEQRQAVVLTYSESKTLSAEGRERIKELEVGTIEPLRECLREGVEAGVLREVDADLVAYDMLLLAHAWALKHWHWEQTMTLDDYAAKQSALVLQGIIAPRARRKYARFLDA